MLTVPPKLEGGAMKSCSLDGQALPCRVVTEKPAGATSISIEQGLDVAIVCWSRDDTCATTMGLRR